MDNVSGLLSLTCCEYRGRTRQIWPHVSIKYMITLLDTGLRRIRKLIFAKINKIVK